MLVSVLVNLERLNTDYFLNIHEFLNLKEKIEIYVFSELSQFDTTKIPDKLLKGKGQTTYSLTLDSHT